MKVIVDANIVFSGILNTQSKIGDLLINSIGLIDFTAPEFLKIEIRNHYNRLEEIGGLSKDEILESEYRLCKDIKFISEEQIEEDNWKAAFNLVKNGDENDISYVAYSIQFNQKIWSGDKQLIKGLKRKGFDAIITTDELFLMRERIRRIKRIKKR